MSLSMCRRPSCGIVCEVLEWRFYELEESGGGGLGQCPECEAMYDVEDVEPADEGSDLGW